MVTFKPLKVYCQRVGLAREVQTLGLEVPKKVSFASKLLSPLASRYKATSVKSVFVKPVAVPLPGLVVSIISKVIAVILLAAPTLSNASIAKTRFLQVENEIGKDDDKWIFLPALGRVRRISSSDKTSSFVGSDFTYGDMETREVSEDTHKLLKEEKYGKYDCYVVESVPVEKDDSQYSKRVTWVTKDSYVPVKAELYSKKTNINKGIKMNIPSFSHKR